MTLMSRLLRRVRRVGLGLIMAAGLGAALGGTLVGAPALASEGSGAPGCPASNPPNQMTLVAGTPQTAILGTAFATGLQVALSNSDGCPVTNAAAGIPVAFSAPSNGASGLFSNSGSDTVIVGADASGSVTAPPFTANTAAGSYTVTASSQYGSVSFSLTNTAAGVPARIVALPLKNRSASVMNRYPRPLQVKVLDANGDPVAGITVTFTLGSGKLRLRHDHLLEPQRDLHWRSHPGERDDWCHRRRQLSAPNREWHGRIVRRDGGRLGQRTHRRVG